MNHAGKINIMREVPSEWDEVMKIAAQIKFGEIIVKVQDGKIVLSEYTIKKKPDDPDELTIYAV